MYILGKGKWNPKLCEGSENWGWIVLNPGFHGRVSNTFLCHRNRQQLWKRFRGVSTGSFRELKGNGVWKDFLLQLTGHSLGITGGVSQMSPVWGSQNCSGIFSSNIGVSSILVIAHCDTSHHTASTPARRAGMLQCPPWRMPRRLSIPTVGIDDSLGIVHSGQREVLRMIKSWSKPSDALYGVNQRRDQSETKGYSDPVPKWNFQHVHVPYTPTGVAWKWIEALFLLGKCKYV